MSAMGATRLALLGVGELRASDGWSQADPMVLVMMADCDLMSLESLFKAIGLVVRSCCLSGVSDGGWVNGNAGLGEAALVEFISALWFLILKLEL